MAALELDEHKAEAISANETLNARINTLLRSEQISPQMATSLLNDFNYSDETAKKLLDSAQALLASHVDLLAEAAHEVRLDEDEIEQLSKVEE